MEREAAAAREGKEPRSTLAVESRADSFAANNDVYMLPLHSSDESSTSVTVRVAERWRQLCVGLAREEGDDTERDTPCLAVAVPRLRVRYSFSNINERITLWAHPSRIISPAP